MGQARGPEHKAEVNSTVFSALDSDFDAARTLAANLRQRGAEDSLGTWKELLSNAPTFNTTFAAVDNRASEFLEGGDPLRALEWFGEAERLALEEGQESVLCGLLGDKAVAFRRVGNYRRAIETYERAIALSSKYDDALNQSRWMGNLGAFLLERGDEERAAALFEDGMTAAARTGQADQLSVALGNLSSLLIHQARYAEAIDLIDKAKAQALDNATLTDIWRSNKIAIRQQWGMKLIEENQLADAARVLRDALEELDLSRNEDKSVAGKLYEQIALLEETQGMTENAIASLRRASELFREAGQYVTATRVEAHLRTMR